jgi:hypothetical protein
VMVAEPPSFTIPDEALADVVVPNAAASGS